MPDGHLEQLLGRMREKELEKTVLEEQERTRIENEQKERQQKLKLHREYAEQKAGNKLKCFQQSTTTGNNRGNTEVALRTLSAQIRSNIKQEIKKTQHLVDSIEALEKKRPREKVTVIQIQELKEELATHPRSIQDVFIRLDEDGNGSLDKHEFMQGLLNMNVDLNEHEFELLFYFFDKNGDGVLDYEEFEPMIRNDDIKEQHVEGPPSLYAGHRKISNLGLRKPSIVRVRVQRKSQL